MPNTDVTVNIRGDASQLKDELGRIEHYSPTGNVGGTPSVGGAIPLPPTSNVLPPNDRMIEDVRREMAQRGVLLVPGSSSMSQIISQYGQVQKNILNEQISSKYAPVREDMQKRMSAEYDEIDERLEKSRKERLANLGDKASDPFYTSVIEQQIEATREAEYRRIGRKYDAEEEDINQREGSEKTKAESELTQAIKELAEYFNRQAQQEGFNPDSYLGRLQAQRQALISERNNASTEEEAQSASRKIADINAQMERATSVDGKGRPFYDSTLQASQGLSGMFGGMQTGDLSSMIMGGGGAIAGLSGMSLKTALRFLGWVGLIAGGVKGASATSETSESLYGLGALSSTSGGLHGAEARKFMGGVLPEMDFRGVKYTDFGLSVEDFAEEARRRTISRGTSEDWYAETTRQIGLEKYLGLSKGSLERGSQYDRYGINITDAITRLVTTLDKIEGSGVSEFDFTRVQEKYDIQQQLMSSYMSRTDKPNYDTANQMLAAFSSIKGITQDARLGSDIQTFQNMIQNPMNDRMKTLIYGTVSDLFPQTGGRVDLIDREIKNPENEGKILKAVIQRIVNQFGGTETTMGYFAFKQLLPGIAPDRLDKMIKQISEGGEVSDVLTKGVDMTAIKDMAAGKKDAWTIEAVGALTDMTKSLKDISDNTKRIMSKLLGTASLPKNITKIGGSK